MKSLIDALHSNIKAISKVNFGEKPSRHMEGFSNRHRNINRKLSLKKDIDMPSLKYIKDIQNYIIPIVEEYHTWPKIENNAQYHTFAINLERSIISDALTFLELKLNQNNKSLIKKTNLERFVQKLYQKLDGETINYKNVMQEATKLLGISKVQDFFEEIYKIPNLPEHNILRSELDLFLFRGNTHMSTSERSIIKDTLVCLEFKLNQNDCSLIKKSNFEGFVRKLNHKLDGKRINFTNVIKEASKILDINEVPDFSEYIHINPNWVDNDMLRTELDLFLNRGNFTWTTFDRSNFFKYLHDPNMEKLANNEMINCWEAIIYSLIRGGALKKSDVADIYNPDLKFHEVLEKFSEAIRWKSIKHITNKDIYKEAAVHVPYYIEISTKGIEYLGGIYHNMISFPDSTNKMIQVLASEYYDGEHDHKTTVFSNWSNWTDSRLGIAPNSDILDLVDEKDLRIIPLHVFRNLFPKVSKDVVDEIKHNK